MRLIEWLNRLQLSLWRRNLATSYTLWILQLFYIVRRTSEWLNRRFVLWRCEFCMIFALLWAHPDG